MAEQAERRFLCPHCWEPISVMVDLSVEGRQCFIEDCEVCCNPIELTVAVTGGVLAAFSAQSPEQ